MKKFFVLFSSVALLSLVACGPSEAEKKAKRDKEVADSTHYADSVAAANNEEAARLMEQTATPDTTVADTVGMGN